MSRLAILGAGLSGLACARELRSAGHSVTVFDKGRGPGGRASTRRTESDGVELSFDHGAQYFTVRSTEFRRQVAEWEKTAVVARWDGRIAVLGPKGVIESYNEKKRYVGVPGMNAMCQHLARGHDVRCGVTVGRLARASAGVALHDQRGEPLGEFDLAVVTAPPIQAADLVQGIAPDLASRALSVEMKPCWAVMASFDDVIDLPYDGAFVNDGPLRWIARNSAKPGRAPSPDRWVLHGSPGWSTEHLEEDADTVVRNLVTAFFEATGTPPRDPSWSRAHRWRYALADEPIEEGSLLDANACVAVCGDWTHGNRVEGAFLAGLTTAHRMHDRLPSR